jgi:gluconolactonase
MFQKTLLLLLNIISAIILLSSASGAQDVGEIIRLDPRFDKLISPGAKIEKLTDGHDWSEGPVWLAGENSLLFSDVPGNIVHRWDPATKKLLTFLKPSGDTGRLKGSSGQGSNGLTIDSVGRLVLMQHGDRRVARLENSGSFTTLAERFEGKRLNSPNDGVFASDGSFYFTDPPYGLSKGEKDPARELDFSGVYRISPEGRLSLLTKELRFPNGAALSPDETTLYVANSDPERPILMAYPLEKSGKIGKGRIFADTTELLKAKKPGLPDGLKVDKAGNIFMTGPGGVYVYAPDGVLLGRIDPGVATANCAWGDDGSTLYLTADNMLCRVKTKTAGLLPGPRLK